MHCKNSHVLLASAIFSVRIAGPRTQTAIPRLVQLGPGRGGATASNNQYTTSRPEQVASTVDKLNVTSKHSFEKKKKKQTHMNIEMLTCFSMNVKLQGGKHKKRTQTNYKPNAEKTLLQLNDNQTVTTRVI